MALPEQWTVHLAMLADDTAAFERVQGLDLFGGCGNFSQAMVNAGITGVKFDLADDATEDALSEQAVNRPSAWLRVTVGLGWGHPRRNLTFHMAL